MGNEKYDGKPIVLVAYRAKDRAQGNNNHWIVNDKTQTESWLLCIKSFLKKLFPKPLIPTPEPCLNGQSPSISIWAATHCRKMEYAGLSLDKLITKQNWPKNALLWKQNRMQSFYIIFFILFKIQSKIWLSLNRKQQENMTHSHKKRHLMETNLKGHLDFGISSQWFKSSCYTYDQEPQRK